jgi:Zn-dependent protease with chaperone function
MKRLPAPEPSPTFLAGRAALAVALMVAFYGLALLVIAALLDLVLLEVRFGKFNPFTPPITIVAIVGAFLILKSIVPRPDRFLAPGPRLEPVEQPRLFAELRRVAAATEQEMPADVYLLLDVNAWVSQRGGFMGIRSRRVMGLGLPLLQVLDRGQLRGVIAHEFGHYHGGDVRIGPWIYHTRAALVRTLRELTLAPGAVGLLTAPFRWYATLFFRVTHAVSRHQELLADALAARVAGALALGSGLRARHAAGLVFPMYLHADVDPVVTAGYLPPLAAGFSQVLERPEISRKLEEAVEQEYKEGKPDPYDTHPPLRERLAALGVTPSGPALPAGERALSLLDGLPTLERDLATAWANRTVTEQPSALNRGRVTSLTSLTWDEVGTRISLPAWRGFVKQFSSRLAALTPAALPTFDWAELGWKLAAPHGTWEEASRAADTVVGVAVGLALVRVGYVLVSHPGGVRALVRGDERVEVFALRERLARSAQEAEAWLAFCERAGIAALDLGVVANGD